MDPIHCATRDDIVKYLVSKLTWIKEEDQKNVGGWKLQMRYTRNSVTQQVWYNKEKNLYAFNNDDTDIFNGFNANMGNYYSFIEMLQGVADIYYISWIKSF